MNAERTFPSDMKPARTYAKSSPAYQMDAPSTNDKKVDDRGRARSKLVLLKACSNSPDWYNLDEAIRICIIDKLEQGCYIASDGTINHYSALIFNVSQNLDITSQIAASATCATVATNDIMTGTSTSAVGGAAAPSTHLVNRLISGEIGPETVGAMTSFDMYPKASEAERKEIMKRRGQKLEQKVSKTYICRKCKGNETIYLEYIGSASDEASKLSIKCVKCSYIWHK
jgi:DNA-directed RNA polymerase subunit M/transcription elongation factor TFIIS